jgi:pimeloyl-ACP methyl ester carboxylesterase
VLGLVLAGCFATFDRPEMHALLEEFRSLRDPIEPAFAREWQADSMERPVPEAFVDVIVEETCKVPARVWSAFAEGLFADEPAGPGTIGAPSLLVWGDRDVFVPRADQDELLKAIPGAELVVRRGGGHAFHWEDPARYASELTAFAGSLAHAA